MKNSHVTGVLCPLILFGSLSLVDAQSSTPASPTDPAITAISVLGTVTEIKTELRQVIVTTAAGNPCGQPTHTIAIAFQFLVLSADYTDYTDFRT